MILSTQQIDALFNRCARCQVTLGDGHLVIASYKQDAIVRFGIGADIGFAGSDIRNFWTHVDCQKQLFKEWKMLPDLQTCLRCKKKLGPDDMIQPVFQILNANASNPADPTDTGILINDRVYFTHCDCVNPRLTSSSGILVV